MSAVAVIIFRLVLEAVGEHRQHVDILFFQACDQVVNEGQIPAHPVGTVEKDADGGSIRNEPAGDVIGYAGAFRYLRVIDALPGHRRRSLVPIISAKVGVGQEQEQISEIEDATAHQVREDRFHLGHRSGTGSYQVFVPFLMPWAGNQRNTVGKAGFNQPVEYITQGALPAQQPQNHRSGALDCL